MDILPTSVEGGITLFFSAAAALVGGVMKIAQVLRKRDERRMQSIPATPQAAPELQQRIATLERDVAVARANWRVEELERALSEVSADQAKLAGALSGERMARQRAEARARELEARLAEVSEARDRAERRAEAAVRAEQELRRQR
jgi:chromosome segregation ATPase